MSTEASSFRSRAVAARTTRGGIYLFMAVFFLGIAIVGFVPRTIATLSGEMAVPAPIVHVHAVLMGSWLLLFLAQTTLIATDNRQTHRKLGLVSLVLAPLMVAVMLTITVGRFGDVLAAANSVPAETSGRRAAFMFFVQGRAAILFGLFYAWAFLSRHGASETHKRMLVLATFVVIDAALGRMAWLPGHPGNWFASDAGYDTLHLYHLLLIAPAIGYDLVTRHSVHRAYVIGLGLFLGFALVTHVLWNAAWWHAAITALAPGAS